MKTRRLAFIAILAGAAALRFVPLWFGLPYPHARPDEATAIGHAAGMLSGDLNPHFFNWPTLTLYLFAGVFTAAKATAGTLSNDAMTLLARGVVAVTGVATIAALAWLGRLIADEATGLVAALFLAVPVLHVRDSHFATTDVPTAFLATLALALVTRAAATKLTRDFGAAGVVSGLAVASKYTAAALIATAVAAPSLAAAGVFAAAMCVGFAAGAPFALLDPRAFLADFAFERSHLSAGQAVDLGRGWVYHLTTSLPYGLGVPIFAAAAAGFVVVLWVCGRRAAGPVAFALVYYAAIGSGRTVFFRYVIPLIPVACLMAAVAVRQAALRLAPRAGMTIEACTALLAVALAAPSAIGSVRLDIRLARTDTRVLAANWLGPRLDADSTVYDAGGDYTRLWLGPRPYHSWRYDEAALSFAGAGDSLPDWIVVDHSPLDGYTRVPAGIERLVRERYTKAYGVRPGPGGGSPVYDRQDAFFLPIAGFRGVERPGPEIVIYRRRSD